MKQIIKNKYIILFILFLIIFVVLMGTSIYMKIENKQYEVDKIDTNYDYVYTKEIDTDTYYKNEIEIPYLNINTKDAMTINNKIVSDYNFVKSNLGYNYNYKAYVSKDIVSIVAAAFYTEEGNTMYETYKYYTYNYDLKNNKAISDQELLGKYKVSLDNVEKFLENKFLNYYYVYIDNEIIDEEDVTFGDFVKAKMIDNFTDEVSFSVEDNSLVVYRPFAITPIYDDYKYFKSKHFRFVLLDNSK